MSYAAANSLLFTSSSMPDEARSGRRNHSKKSGGRIEIVLVATSLQRRAELEDALAHHEALQGIGSFQSLASLRQEGQITSGVILLDFPSRKSREAENRELENLEALLENPALSALVLIEDADRAPISVLLNFGSVSILADDASATEIEAAIKALAAGLVTLDPEIAKHIAEHLPQNSPPNTEPIEELTRRETEVLRLLARGLGNKEIAARLGISEHTAKFHISSILGKLAVSSRTEAVALGLRRGLIMF